MTRQRCPNYIALLVAIVTCTGTRVAVADTLGAYRVTDLGTLGGTGSAGLAINARGQVTGSFNTIGDVGSHAFLWTPTTPNGTVGTMQDLGTLAGTQSQGSGINSIGQVTGHSLTAEDAANHAFLYDGTMHDLAIPRDRSSEGNSINDSGHVTGVSFDGANPRAFLYDGTRHDLNVGEGFSAGTGINSSGQVTGWVANDAFLWTPTTPNGNTGTTISLGYLGGGFASAGSAVNNSGQVTGKARMFDGAYHAFLYDGAIHDLGTLGGMYSNGYAINDSGHVIGESSTAGDVVYTAFLYTSEMGMVDLNTLVDPLSGWRLLTANGINNAGQITGSGYIGDEIHGYLLTPAPEPGGLSMMLIGALLMVRRCRSAIARREYSRCRSNASESRTRNSMIKLQSTLVLSTLAALAFISPPPPARAAGLTALEMSGDSSIPFFESHARGVNADGSIVVGYGDSLAGAEAFRYTGGMTAGLGDLNGGTVNVTSSAHNVSSNGSVIVGESNVPGGVEAFRYSGGVMSRLGDLPGGTFESVAHAASSDGSVIVGRGNSMSGVEAFRYSGGMMTGLGDFPGGEFESYAFDISDDGSIIVGTGSTATGYEGFRYSSGVMTGIGDLPGGTVSSGATAISGDGLVIVGASHSASGGEAFRLVGGLMTGLGDLPGGNFGSTANDVSADGSIVVGWSYSAVEAEAFLWNQTDGMRRLWDVMLGHGINPADHGWAVLNIANAISADGKTIVGWGTRFDQAQAFVAVIPEPESIALLAFGLPLMAFHSRKYRIRHRRR